MIKESGGIYLGTCRELGNREGSVRFRLPHQEVRFTDRQHGSVCVDPNQFGDPNLVRRDGLVSYNLAVVADDIREYHRRRQPSCRTRGRLVALGWGHRIDWGLHRQSRVVCP